MPRNRKTNCHCLCSAAIAAAPGGLAHEGTLGTIAIAATAEHGHDSRGSSGARDELAGERCEIAQRIVGVSIVDHHSERLAAVDALEPSRHMRKRFDAAGNRLRAAAARIAGGRRSQDVIHIDAPDERREDGNLLLRRGHVEARSVWADVHLLGVEVAALPPIGQHDGATLTAERGQLRAVFVVKVGDCRTRCIGATAFEQNSLGGEVFVHRLVIVEMIASQVGEDGDVEGHAEHAFLRQGMR